MLLSMMNMYLRDNYGGSLDCLCDDWGVDRQHLLQLMADAGWEYNAEAGKFW